MIYNNWMQKSLLDDSQVKMLADADEDGDFALLIELMEIYRDETKPLIQKLQVALEQGDCQQISRTAHAIAGSSSNLGLLRFSHLMKHVEYDERDLNEIPRLLTTIPVVYRESMDALQVFTKT